MAPLDPHGRVPLVSEIKADHIHELEGVGRTRNTGAEAVIERHRGAVIRVAHRFGQVNRDRQLGQLRAFREGQIVRRNSAEAPPLHQVANDPARRNLPLGRVRPLQHLIENVEDRRLPRPARIGRIDDLLEPQELGHEEGDAGLQ